MSLTVDLPPEALRRLEAEAARRSLTVDELIVELAAGLPRLNRLDSRPRRLGFVGIGASGDTRPFDNHRGRYAR